MNLRVNEKESQIKQQRLKWEKVVQETRSFLTLSPQRPSEYRLLKKAELNQWWIESRNKIKKELDHLVSKQNGRMKTLPKTHKGLQIGYDLLK